VRRRPTAATSAASADPWKDESGKGEWRDATLSNMTAMGIAIDAKPENESRAVTYRRPASAEIGIAAYPQGISRPISVLTCPSASASGSACSSRRELET
jgi:hypothetical protein